MKVKTVRKTYRMEAESIKNITRDVEAEIDGKEGFVVLMVLHSTAGIGIMEDEPGLREDIFTSFERVAPSNATYQHNRLGEGNGKSHIRSTLLGPSLVLPITNGTLELGTWQSVLLFNFDVRERERTVVMKFFFSD
jgi:secondary thiamine-phosphate synthase enzyme